MKWERTSERTHELVFDNQVRMLLVDGKPCAALVTRVNSSPVVIRSQRSYPDDIEHIINSWVNHQPVTSAIVPQSTLDRLLDQEGKL
jgi:hypothetical protein